MADNTPTQSLRLYKKEKLCSAIAIGQLFGPGAADDVNSALAYPLRMVWRNNPRRSSDAAVQFLVSIPKKRIRHAVDRVLMRRRVREAFRLIRHQYPVDPALRLDVAFIYVGNAKEPYDRVERSMSRLLKTLSHTAPASANPYEAGA